RGIASDSELAEEWSLDALAPLGERVRFEPFEAGGKLPDGGNVYVLAGMVRELEDTAAVRFLSDCHGQMSPGVQAILVETLVPEVVVAPRPAVRADVGAMLTSGGEERALDEYRVLLERSGFRFESCSQGPADGLSVVFGRKGLL